MLVITLHVTEGVACCSQKSNFVAIESAQTCASKLDQSTHIAIARTTPLTWLLRSLFDAHHFLTNASTCCPKGNQGQEGCACT